VADTDPAADAPKKAGAKAEGPKSEGAAKGAVADPAAAKAKAAAAAAAKKKEEKPWPFPPQHKEPQVTEDLEALKERFGGAITAVGDMSGKPVAYVDPERALEVLTHCKDTLAFDHLPFVSACDYKDEGILEVHWQLYSYETLRSLAVKAHIPRDAPRIPSVVSLWAGADWHERETWDLFGIQFDGHPDLRRIFMPEGWRGHPLRKDYDRTPQYIGMNDQGEDVVFDKPGPYRW
jgi:NADH-quinone oxidoreductase subunit C